MSIADDRDRLAFLEVMADRLGLTTAEERELEALRERLASQPTKPAAVQTELIDHLALRQGLIGEHERKAWTNNRRIEQPVDDSPQFQF